MSFSVLLVAMINTSLDTEWTPKVCEVTTCPSIPDPRNPNLMFNTAILINKAQDKISNQHSWNAFLSSKSAEHDMNQMMQAARPAARSGASYPQVKKNNLTHKILTQEYFNLPAIA